MSTVGLKNIYKIYDNSVTAVSDFNLEIADKEFISAGGPSGCGRVHHPADGGGPGDQQGRLCIDGKLVNDVGQRPGHRDGVPRATAIPMTVREHGIPPLKLKKVPKEEIQQRVEPGGGDPGHHPVSGPEAQGAVRRPAAAMAIRRAIVREPKVLLMDEPLSNLDAKLRNQMRAEIIKLRQRINTTFMYVTHDQTEAMTLGDRIVIMKDGFMQQIGTPRRSLRSPSTSSWPASSVRPR